MVFITNRTETLRYFIYISYNEKFFRIMLHTFSLALDLDKVSTAVLVSARSSPEVKYTCIKTQNKHAVNQQR